MDTVKPPRSMRLTERDLRILEAIHAHDGMLGAHQIQHLFFNSWRTTRERLSKLYQNGYITRPDRRKRASLSDMVYWLTEQGAEIVAALHGQELRELKWRKPGTRWTLTEHDLLLNWCRIILEQACERLDRFELEEWVSSSEFWAYPDEVEYTDERGRKAKRRVRPDGFFSIRYLNRTEGKWYTYRHVIECDMGTEDLPRWGRERVRPTVAYFYSQAYERRFGFKSGRLLVISTSQRRIQNMRRQTEAVAGRDAGMFHFTVFSELDLARPEAILVDPIWWRGGEEYPRSLFEDS